MYHQPGPMFGLSGGSPFDDKCCLEVLFPDVKKKDLRRK
jgi:hypothetical protein